MINETPNPEDQNMNIDITVDSTIIEEQHYNMNLDNADIIVEPVLEMSTVENDVEILEMIDDPDIFEANLFCENITIPNAEIKE